MNDPRPLPWINYLTIMIVVSVLTVVAVDRLQWSPSLRLLTTHLYRTVIYFGAFAVILGTLNILWLHLQRIRRGERGWANSIVLLLTAVIVIAAGVLDPAGAQSVLVEWIFDSLIFPGQATLFALLAFFMVSAAFRFLRIGRPGAGWLLAGALVILLIQMPATNRSLPAGAGKIGDWLLNVPVMATLRGAILGSSLALLLAGLRFVTGRT